MDLAEVFLLRRRALLEATRGVDDDDDENPRAEEDDGRWRPSMPQLLDLVEITTCCWCCC